MPHFRKLQYKQKGFANIILVLVLLLLLAGMAVGVYLVQQKTNLFPKAETLKPAEPETSLDLNIEKKPSIGKVGMAIQFPLPRIPENGEVISLLKEGGVQVFHSGYIQWDDVEQTPGVYDFSSVESTFKVIRDNRFDFEVAIDIGSIIALSYDRPFLPSYITFKGFDDPYLKERYLAFLDAFLDRYGKEIDYLLLHTEGAGNYFTNYHPEQLDGYCNLMNKAMKHVKQKTPNIKVGNNGGGEGKSEKTEIVKCFTKEADFIGTGSYPEDDTIYKNPEDIETVIDNLVAGYSPKKLVLEIGYYTSPKIGGSEQKQIEFVKSVFRSLVKHRAHIEYLAYFELYDMNKEAYGSAVRLLFPPDTDETFMQKLIEFVTSLGLINESVVPKPAWQEWKNQVSLYHIPSPTPTPTPTPTPSPTPNPTPTPTVKPSPLPPASVAPNRFDLNSDGKINSFDAAIFLDGWKSGAKSSKFDFNDDKVINSFDWTILLNRF